MIGLSRMCQASRRCIRAPQLHPGAFGLFLSLLCASAARGASEITVVPVELKGGNNFATIWIGGVALRTVIDTGGYRTIGISPDALAKIQVRFTGTTTERTDGSGIRFTGRDFLIPELRLGNGVFHNVQGFERHQAASGNFGGPPLFDALIGRDFLQRYALVVDYPQGRFELHPASSGRSVCGPPATSITPNTDGFMFSVVETDTGPLKLGWDTGATISVIQRSLATGRGLKLDQDGFYATRRFSPGPRDTGPIEMVALNLAGVPDVDGLIGFNFFEKHRVCFDYARRTVSVTR
jgi:hypothetical protein